MADTAGKKIRVMVVEDSAYMRYVISEILASDPDIEVVEKARDGLDALERLRRDLPDVITLDIQMPRMDGLAFLQEIRGKFRVPTIMISSLTQEGAIDTLKALELGALDFVPKPTGMLSLTLEDIRDQIIAKVKMAATIKPMVTMDERPATAEAPVESGAAPHEPQVSEKTPKPKREPLSAKVSTLKKVVAIGSSTGGPRALSEIVPLLPGDLSACVVIVQHMPPRFTTSLAERLDAVSEIKVVEAASGDKIKPGVVYIAPGDHHILVGRNDTIYLNQEPPLHGVRPSVDVFMKSLASAYGRRSIGVILTGMGVDGAEGVKNIKEAGGTVFAEHHSTCVVYGMPKAAAETGCVDRVLILPRIADVLIETVEN